MSARDNILKRLRSGQTPFTDVEPIAERQVMVPLEDTDLLAHFITQAEGVSATVYQPDSAQSAWERIHALIGDDETVLAWDVEHIPVDGLQQMLTDVGITIADARDGSVCVGITGAEAALAATGSLVLSAKPGKPRSVSLLPHVHVAVVRRDQILPHLDAWLDQQAEHPEPFREVGNHIIVTGASRTADIGMELVLGAHGPAELYIVIM